MITFYDKKINVGYFDSVNEYINYLEDTPRLLDRDKSSETGDYHFTGTKSLKEALDLCKYGDEELGTYVYNQVLKIDNIDTVNKNRQAYINDIVGFTPNVPNYVMGIPTNMIRDNRTIIKSKIINIYINLSAHAGTSSDSIKKNAAKYVAAINKLEQEGYRCNVYAGNCADTWSDDEYCVIVKVKGDREPLNLTKMAFPLCHPSMLRRLAFKWIETIPINFGGGYGRPVDDDRQVKKLVKKVLGDRHITVLSIGHNKGNVDDVVELLKERGMVNE